MVTAESTVNGTGLVWLGARGNRLGNLTKPDKVGQIDREPIWSPDGKVLAFTSNRGVVDQSGKWGIWLVDPRGGEVKNIFPATKGLRDISWAEDKIVFSVERGQSYDVMELTTAGKSKTINSGNVTLMPSFSRSGDFAYVTIDDKRPRIVINEVATAIQGTYPKWSPQGDRLAYSALVKDGNKTNVDIVVADKSGTTLFAIAEPLADQTIPVWGNKGKLLFATATYRSEETGDPIHSAITVIDLQAEDPKWRLFQDMQMVTQQRWSAINPRVSFEDVSQLPLYEVGLRHAILTGMADKIEKDDEETKAKEKLKTLDN